MTGVRGAACVVASVAAMTLARAGSGAASDAAAVERLRELGRAAAAVHSLRAAFVQEKHVTIVHDVLRSAGTFVLDKAGGRIAWDVAEPGRERIVITKGGVFAGGKPVSGAGGGRLSPLPMLEGFTDLFSGLSEATARRFEVTLLDRQRFRLVPRSAELARWIRAIEIVLDEQTATPRRFRLEEPGGDVTEIDFQDVVVNPPLGDADFAP